MTDKIQQKLEAIRNAKKRVSTVLSYKELDDDGLLQLLSLIEYFKTTNWTTFSVTKTAQELGTDWKTISNLFRLLIDEEVLLLHKEVKYPIGTAKIYRLDWERLDGYFCEIDDYVNSVANNKIKAELLASQQEQFTGKVVRKSMVNM